MPSITQQLETKGLIKPPTWLSQNVMYETLMGSVAYGVSGDTSDCDVYGFCIPKKEMLFPHLAGEVFGFGRQIQRFEQFQHHAIVPNAVTDKIYDLQIFSIVKYFQLLMDNNPNIIDSLFTTQECVLHITHVGNMVRDKRKLFLHKGCWHKFRGYAFSQAHKLKSKNPIGKRKELIDKYGCDTKYLYHIVRLLDECQQILIEGDIDLMRNREQLKAIRRGEMPEEDVLKWMADKELQLEKIYVESSLSWGPDEPAIKQLLLDCLEHHYGSLANCVVTPDASVRALAEVRETLQRYDRACSAVTM